jgi:hypothetical protein
MARNAKLVREETSKQLKRRRILVGYHHKKFNALPSTWTFSESLIKETLQRIYHLTNYSRVLKLNILLLFHNV